VVRCGQDDQGNRRKRRPLEKGCHAGCYAGFFGGSSVIENMTRQNLAMFERAMQMFSPFALKPTRGEDEPKPSAAPEPKAKPSEDISELKSEIEAMRKQLAELSQRK